MNRRVIFANHGGRRLWPLLPSEYGWKIIQRCQRVPHSMGDAAHARFSSIPSGAQKISAVNEIHRRPAPTSPGPRCPLHLSSSRCHFLVALFDCCIVRPCSSSPRHPIPPTNTETSPALATCHRNLIVVSANGGRMIGGHRPRSVIPSPRHTSPHHHLRRLSFSFGGWDPPRAWARRM